MQNDPVHDLKGVMAAEERKRLHRDRNATPEERLERFFRLQASVDRMLASNPEALAAFTRRNHHQRRQSRVEHLQAEMLGQTPRGE